jgi:thioredoxin 1
MNKFIYFSAPWCGPCRQLAPTMEQVAAEGITIQKVNVDNEPEFAKQYNIRSIPTVVLVNQAGEEITRTTGALSKQTYIDLYSQN